MVKDHRTNYEESNVDSVMDGELDGMINSYLSSISGNNFAIKCLVKVIAEIRTSAITLTLSINFVGNQN